MRKWLFLFALISMLSNVFAQNVIIGKITEKDGKALSGATVMVEDANTSGIKGYAISDGKGIYKLSFSSDASKLSVRVKAFNHKEKVQTVDNKSQTLNFSLELNFTEIKEIVLKNKLITKKGDTITYDLKSFSSKSNRTLADVLKKMPGMEVQSDGTVIYQGKPINKFNVNGKDLMEGAYGTVNNALPKDAVKDVQVMENHQPINY